MEFSSEVCAWIAHGMLVVHGERRGENTVKHLVRAPLSWPGARARSTHAPRRVAWHTSHHIPVETKGLL